MTDATSDFSPNLSLPLLLPAQAQKHVTVNEALTAIDALLMGAVIATGLDTPPVSPSSGDCFILSDAPSEPWSGHSEEIAVWMDNAWVFHIPQPGWRVWDLEQNTLMVFDGTIWAPLKFGGSDLAEFGVNTDADAVNRFSVKSDAVLISHDDVTPGSGDVRLTLNKTDAAATASLLFQSGFSGRSEVGLTGDDSLSIRASADGQTWQDCIRFDAASGHAGMGALPDASDRLLVNGPLSASDPDGRATLTPNGRIDLHRSTGGPTYIRARSSGSRLHLGATDAGSTVHSNAVVIDPDAEQVSTSFSIGPWNSAAVDLGFAGSPFRDLYLTNAPVISSDRRGKYNIETFDAGLSLVKALNPVTFERGGSDKSRHVGLIAQHVREALQNEDLLGTGIWRLADPDDANSEQALSYVELIPVLIDAINELRERLEEVEGHVRALR